MCKNKAEYVNTLIGNIENKLSLPQPLFKFFKMNKKNMYEMVNNFICFYDLWVKKPALSTNLTLFDSSQYSVKFDREYIDTLKKNDVVKNFIKINETLYDIKLHFLLLDNFYWDQLKNKKCQDEFLQHLFKKDIYRLICFDILKLIEYSSNKKIKLNNDDCKTCDYYKRSMGLNNDDGCCFHDLFKIANKLSPKFEIYQNDSIKLSKKILSSNNQFDCKNFFNCFLISKDILLKFESFLKKLKNKDLKCTISFNNKINKHVSKRNSNDLFKKYQHEINNVFNVYIFLQYFLIPNLMEYFFLPIVGRRFNLKQDDIIIKNLFDGDEEKFNDFFVMDVYEHGFSEKIMSAIEKLKLGSQAEEVLKLERNELDLLFDNKFNKDKINQDYKFNVVYKNDEDIIGYKKSLIDMLQNNYKIDKKIYYALIYKIIK